MRSRASELARASLLALISASFTMTVCTACSSRTNSSNPSQANASAAAAAASARAVLPPGTEWAAWINRDIQIDLEHLPRAYTCDELWYKFHAVLLAIGAREYMSIEPYDCGKGASGGRSPRVHLRFFTLRQVTGDQIRWANTRAVEKTVVLSPGEPKRLVRGDCALVQQLQGTLFPYLDLPVSSARFDCSAPSGHDFDLSAKVLERWPARASAN